MFRTLLGPSLTILRILIIAGAVLTIVQPSAPAEAVRLQLVSDYGMVREAASAAPHAVVRVALTAISLSLL